MFFVCCKCSYVSLKGYHVGSFCIMKLIWEKSHYFFPRISILFFLFACSTTNIIIKQSEMVRFLLLNWTNYLMFFHSFCRILIWALIKTIQTSEPILYNLFYSSVTLTKVSCPYSLPIVREYFCDQINHYVSEFNLGLAINVVMANIISTTFLVNHGVFAIKSGLPAIKHGWSIIRILWGQG